MNHLIFNILLTFEKQLIHAGILFQTKFHKNQVPNKFKIQPLTLIKV
jgi:hypothetical protein